MSNNEQKPQLKCDICKKEVVSTIEDPQSCDFCGRVLCIQCEEKSYYFFSSCKECGEMWCTYDGPNIDYVCRKRGRYNGGCEE